MKKYLLLVTLLFCTACTLTAVKARKFNFVFTTRDIIKDPADDLESYSRVIIDRRLTNETVPAPMSAPQHIKIKLSKGNHLIQVTKYVRDPADNSFKPLNEKYQPRERFVRTYQKKITFYNIKYSENSCRYELSVRVLSNRFYENYFDN